MPVINRMFAVKVNEFQFHIDESVLASADIVMASDSSVHMVHQHQSVKGEVTATDSSGKKMTVEINGETYHVEIRDELDQMLDKMGFGATAGKQVKEIRAPMPGLVLQVSVADGQPVKQGDKILILEAMKMENSIIVHADSVIKKIIVGAGDAVEKGQVLVELE